ncbi:hypothetical protein B0H13DRAFT_2019911 [Mycena leptocephala]|nr:hypothetical protein B0H13DRAFT_2019911 [Mycena leptocephala]
MSLALQYPPDYVNELALPLMIGFMLSAPLYGIGIAQSMHYFSVFNRDSKYLRILVALLLMIDTVHMVLLITSYNQWFLVQFLAPSFPRALTIDSLLTYLVTFLSQSVYAMRIWILSSKNRVITALVILPACTQLVAGIIEAVVVTIDDTFASIVASNFFRVPELVQLSSSLGCDVIIVCAMLYFLQAHNSGIDRTSRVVNKIVTYTISAGLLTSACTVASLIAWQVSTKTLHFLIFHFVLSKLYFNSVLAMLNSRTKFRHQLNAPTSFELTDTVEQSDNSSNIRSKDVGQGTYYL